MKWGKKQQAKWDKKNLDLSVGRAVNSLEHEGWVQDPKTGKWSKGQTKKEGKR